MNTRITKWAVVLFVLAGLASTGEASAQRPARSMARAMASRVVLSESEPNDTRADADHLSLDDQATGEVNPAGDVDHFVLWVTAGTTVDIDVDAAKFGFPTDPTLELFDSAGLSLAFNDNSDGLDSRIRFTITVTGNYFIAVRRSRLDLAGDRHFGVSTAGGLARAARQPARPAETCLDLH